jgi:hypothetical protein
MRGGRRGADVGGLATLARASFGTLQYLGLIGHALD